VWPSGLYILTAVVLQQQSPALPVSWEQIGGHHDPDHHRRAADGRQAPARHLGGQGDGDQRCAAGRAARIYEKQLADLRADSDKRYAEMVAQSNQRLVDNITEWRARYAELGQDRDFWRQNALKPVEAVETIDRRGRSIEERAGA
jgi:hypothetical protein